MFTTCKRCQFRISTRARICNICGVNQPGETLLLVEEKIDTISSMQKVFLQSTQLLKQVLSRSSKQQRPPQLELVQPTEPSVPTQLVPVTMMDTARQRTAQTVIGTQSRHSTMRRKINKQVEESVEQQSNLTLRYQQAFEAASRREQLAELKTWFENYGKNGLLTEHEEISKTA